MAHNQRWNQNEEKYDATATEELRNHLADATEFNLNFQLIQRLIREGANPHLLVHPLQRVEEQSITPLDFIATLGEGDFIQELFSMGLEPTRNTLINALKSRKNQIRTIDAILNADPNMIDQKGNDGFDKDTTPLIVAIKKDLSEGIIEHLLKRGANPDLQGADGRTPLMYAAKIRKSVVDLLLRYGAETQLENKKGNLAHSYAKSKGMKNLLKNERGNRKGGYRKTHHRRKHHRSHKRKTQRRR